MKGLLKVVLHGLEKIDDRSIDGVKVFFISPWRSVLFRG